MLPRFSLVASLSLALAFNASATPARAQYDVGQRPGMATTDDPRRIPIPPRDTSSDPVVVLRGGVLIDGTGAAPVPDAVLVMRGNRIVDAGPGQSVALPAHVDRTVDVRGLYVVPGLIDLHGHFSAQRGSDGARYRDSDSAAAIRGAERLGRYLDGGITAVRDLGTPGDVALKLKEAVQRGILEGPRVFWCGRRIVSTGGHGDELTGAGTGRPASGDPRTHVANGPDGWRLAVREEIRMGADVIKLTAPYTRAEVTAAVDEAHMHGLRAAADTFGEYIRWGVEAGLDSVEHGLAMPPGVLKLMVEKETALVPTITAFFNPLTYGYPSAGIPSGGFFFTMSRRFTVSHADNMASLREAHRLGVRIGVGTDIPSDTERRYPGDYFTELGFLKEAGLSNADVLASATRVGAAILDMADTLGTLEPGKVADVLIVEGNPLDDFANLRNMRLVVANGRIVRDRRAAASKGAQP